MILRSARGDTTPMASNYGLRIIVSRILKNLRFLKISLWQEVRGTKWRGMENEWIVGYNEFDFFLENEEHRSFDGYEILKINKDIKKRRISRWYRIRWKSCKKCTKKSYKQNKFEKHALKWK